MRFYENIFLDYADIASYCRDAVTKRTDGQDVTVTTAAILDDSVSQKYMKRKGQYVTVEYKAGKNTPRARNECAHILSRELSKLLPKKENGPVLAVGLGNAGLTADSLGPLTLERLQITRQYFETDHVLSPRYASLAGFAPGVLGVTGIESFDITHALVERLKPSCVVAIDTLASGRVSRLANAFQISNAGLHPGAGVGNARSPLNEETLGVPVIALGVPLVLYAGTIAKEVLDEFVELAKITSDRITREVAVDRVLKTTLGELIVAPKDIDTVVAEAATVIAAAINCAVHKTPVEDTLRE